MRAEGLNGGEHHFRAIFDEFNPILTIRAVYERDRETKGPTAGVRANEKQTFGAKQVRAQTEIGVMVNVVFVVTAGMSVVIWCGRTI